MNSTLLMIGFAFFLFVDGIMLIRGGRGLVEWLLPVSVADAPRRWISASVYFALSAFVFVWVFRV